MAGGDESHTHLDGLQVARVGAVELGRGAVLAGRYEIESVLGRGGAGLVLRAHDRELREAVAIKVLRPELGLETRWIERLAREVKLARQLRHPNVCRVFDFEKADGHFFIVMELASGGTLRRELEVGAVQARAPEARLADARAVAAGLAAIHEAGIAHRDVTPQNVLRMADGRLVVSDFGLATEVSQTTTSLHGGTVAYMAPEIVRGQRGTFTSDVWSLGVVIHEIVFGVRPTWSKPVGGTLVAPTLGRTLARDERLAYEVCRACTAESSSDRPKTAGEVAAWLAEGKVGARRARRPWLLLALALLGGTALGVLRWARRPPAPTATRSGDLPYPAPQGTPADWAASSRVLATFDARLDCLVLLPDERTVRYVWGRPRQAEDLDIATGKRGPSPVVPEAYAEGCPDLSADGRRLVYQGYSRDGRAFAFMSEHPDGREASPVVAIADPSMSSEPKWLPGGRAFSLDVDHMRMGVFSLDTRRLTVLPDATRETYHSATAFVIGARIYVAAARVDPFGADVVGYRWPLMAEDARFYVPGLLLGLASLDHDTLVATTITPEGVAHVLRIDPARRSVRDLAVVPGQVVRYPILAQRALVFVSGGQSSDLWLEDGGVSKRIARATNIDWADDCGPAIIATRTAGSDGVEVVKMDLNGHVLGTVSRGRNIIGPRCSPDGRVWYGSLWGAERGIVKCAGESCVTVFRGPAATVDVSPDGQRIAFSLAGNAGLIIAWMASGGGPMHEITGTETICQPVWSTNRDLWVSRQIQGALSWIEMDTDTGRATGRTMPGSTNCANGLADSASPGRSKVRVEMKKISQIRMLPRSLVAP